MVPGGEGGAMNGPEELAELADRAYYVIATFGLACVLATWWSWGKRRR